MSSRSSRSSITEPRSAVCWCAPPGEYQLSDEDLRVLIDVAAQVAVAVHAARLTEALRASRERLGEDPGRGESLITPRSPRWDQPTLTGVSMHAEAAAVLVRPDPLPAARELEQVSVDLHDALAEVRRLVDGMRPVKLGRFGLFGALRVEAARLGPRTSVEADDVETLPASGRGDCLPDRHRGTDRWFITTPTRPQCEVPHSPGCHSGDQGPRQRHQRGTSAATAPVGSP